MLTPHPSKIIVAPPPHTGHCIKVGKITMLQFGRLPLVTQDTLHSPQVIIITQNKFHSPWAVLASHGAEYDLFCAQN